MSTLSPALEATVYRAIARVRGTEPRAAHAYGTGCIGRPERTSDEAKCRPSVPRRYQRCLYCGQPGAEVCVGHEDLPALDSQRAPELYLGTGVCREH